MQLHHHFNFQPILQNERIKIRPLEMGDFDALYPVASDPLIWEQHPQNNRYELEVFKAFFDAAINSGGALLIFNSQTNEVIGSSRYYDYNHEQNSIVIGYTFLARSHWGGLYNLSLKKLMLEHAFSFVGKVLFHVGANNIRSQRAVEKMGAQKVREVDMPFPGERGTLNYIYELDKSTWLNSVG